MILGLPSLTDADSGYLYLKLAMPFRSYYDVRRDRMLNVFWAVLEPRHVCYVH